MQELVIPELFGNAWNLMKSRFVPLVALAAIGGAPGWIASILDGIVGLPVSMFSLPITIPIHVLTYGGALAVAHAHAFRGEAWGVGDGLSFSAGKFLPMLGVVILQGLAIGLGTCACIVPGVFVFLALVAAVPLVLFDSVPVTESFSQSYHLSKGSWGPIFVVFFATALIMALPLVIGVCVLGAGAGIMMGEQGLEDSSGAISIISVLFTAPITVVGGAYFNSLYIVVYRALLRRHGRTDDQVVEVFA